MQRNLRVFFVGVLLLPSIGTAQWERLETPAGAVLSCLGKDGPLLFVGTHSGGVFCSADSGRHWSRAGLDEVSITAITVSGEYVWAASGGGILYRTTDAGVVWTRLSEGYEVGAHRVALGADRTMLYSLTTYTQGGPEPRTILSYSTNRGNSWAERGLPTTWAWALAASSELLYVATDAGLYRSEDKGMQWESAGLKRACILSLAAGERHVFAGADSGIYCCSESGGFLTLMGMEMERCAIVSLAQDGAHVFALASTGELWRRPLEVSSTSVPGSTREVSPSFTLCDNYPNPFNPSTTIEYAVEQPAYVRLTVVNMLGEEVATLVAVQHSAGWFRARWDARGFPSGTYFYRLTVGDHDRTKQMLLVK